MNVDERKDISPIKKNSSGQRSSSLTVLGEAPFKNAVLTENEGFDAQANGDSGRPTSVDELDESSEDSEKEIDLTPGTLNRIDDPVRLYLNEMARVSLLTREGEIELAKKIEEGKAELVRAMVGLPLTLARLEAWRAGLKSGAVRVRELVHEPSDEEDVERAGGREEDESELLRQTLGELGKVRRLSSG